MTEVTVLYFGGLKDALACSREVVSLAAMPPSLSHLYRELCQRHPELSRSMASVRLARNEEFLPGMGEAVFQADILLDSGDVIAFIPPVSGG